MTEEFSVILRPLLDSESDYTLLKKWYQQESIYQYFEQRPLNYSEIVKKYYPRTLKNAATPVFIIEANELPIGIIQYSKKENRDFKQDILCSEYYYEIDVFIGELQFRGKKIGPQSIRLLMDMLVASKGSCTFVMCPVSNNRHAISCYQKCGFEIKQEYVDKDTVGNAQNYLLMIRKG